MHTITRNLGIHRSNFSAVLHLRMFDITHAIGQGTPEILIVPLHWEVKKLGIHYSVPTLLVMGL
jgi:hypothetical protein